MTTTVTLWIQRAIAEIVLLPVRVYRLLVSPLKRTPTCRFLPTCSEYAIDAVKKRGVVVGTALAIGRVARCHPLCSGGFDPVPEEQG